MADENVNNVAVSGRRRHQRRLIDSYEMRVRVDEDDDALLLVDVREFFADGLVEMTLMEVIAGQLQVTFATREATLWEDNWKKVILRSNDVNLADRHWHRIELVRY